jgi:hypothetical protein
MNRKKLCSCVCVHVKWVASTAVLRYVNGVYGFQVMKATAHKLNVKKFRPDDGGNNSL